MKNPGYEKSTKRSIYIFLFLLSIFFISLYLFYFRLSKTNQQILEFTPISTPILNPLMGWAPWATIDVSHQPHTLVYMDLTWRDFEPSEGVYDFAGFENAQQMARWRQGGQRVVFRFVSDKPGNEAHMDIPDWLFEKMNGDGEFYDNQYGQGFSPNYSNPVMIKSHHLAIKALGDRYGRDGFFAFIELGSLGHWGEWHESPELKQLPPENIRDLYVEDYIDAFPDTHLLMRRPFTIAQRLSLGLYNDMTGSVADTDTWLGWIQNGGDYLPNESNTIAPMPTGWEKAPIGGEQAPNIGDEVLYDTNLDTTLRLLRESHATFIGPGSPYEIESNSPLQTGIEEVRSTIGYRLYIKRVEMPLDVKLGKELQVKLEFSNAGIAPFYYKWPALIYLFDESGQPLEIYPLEMDLRQILPGGSYNVAVFMPVDTVANGRYSIGFAIIDPLTGKPGVKLANENTRQDLIQEVGTFEVDWLLDCINEASHFGWILFD